MAYFQAEPSLGSVDGPDQVDRPTGPKAWPATAKSSAKTRGDDMSEHLLD
jgi:hypothetical protein